MASDHTQSTIIFPIVKVVIAGDEGVGKTSLIRRYCTGMFEEPRIVTTGVDFQIKIVDVDGNSIKLSIWDIAGQERFGAFRDTFYRGAKVVALVYDLANPATLDNLPRWHAGVAQICPTARFVVVGNKLDLGRRVDARAGGGMGAQHGLALHRDQRADQRGSGRLVPDAGRIGGPEAKQVT